ncbi:MAG TPA: sulfotransferase [Fodinibius sp.]|nr:sulfotransferase [Fodinibius sp.]
MKFDVKELQGVLNEFVSNSVDYFKTKYQRQKALENIQRFDDFPERVLRDTPALFVLSTGRTGTDFVRHLLQQAKGLRVEHEAVPGLAAASRFLYDHSLVNHKGGQAAFLAARYHMIQDAYMFKKQYVETNNRLTFFAPAIRDLMPESRFVHLVRHPGAFVRSGMRRGYYTSEYIVDYGKLRPTEQDEVFEEWESYSRIEKISWLWYRTNTLIEEFKKSCPERILTVKSEDLFTKPDEFVSRVLNFVNEPVPDQINTDLGPKNSQRSGAFPRYERWNNEDKKKLQAIAGKLAAEYEYSL